MASAVDPSVVADDISTPEGASAAASAIDPTVIGTIELTPAAAIAATTALDPTVLGDQVITPAVATAIATAFGPTLPGLTVPAIDYDGFQSQLFKAGGFDGVSDGADISYAEFWLPAVDGVEMVLAFGDGTVPWVVLRNSDNEYEFIGGVAGAVFHVVTDPVPLSVGRVLVLATATGTTASLTVTDATGTEVGVNTPGSATNLDFTADTRFGSWDGSTGMQQGTVHQKWFDTTYIGPANDADVIEQFLNTTTHALRNPGTDGSNPLDGDHNPVACFKDPAGSHFVNSGSGGDADTGAGGSGIFAAGVSPGDYAEDFSPGNDVVLTPGVAAAAAAAVDPFIEGNTVVSPAAAIAAASAIDPSVDTGGAAMPAIVAGSIVNATQAASSSEQTYFADYDPGAGSNRQVYCVMTAVGTGFNPFDQDTVTHIKWGGVPFKRLGHHFQGTAGNDVFAIVGYLDEADFPAPGTNAVVAQNASTSWAMTLFTVENAVQGAPFGLVSAANSAGAADLSATLLLDDTLVITVLGIHRDITDVAATGTGHSIVDNYDAGATNGERLVIGALAGGAAGAKTLGYSFTDDGAKALAIGIAPAGAYAGFIVDDPVETDFGADTAHLVNMPATVNAGDLLIVAIEMYFDELTGGSSITTPSGWTSKSSVTQNFATTDSHRFAVFLKVAAGSEGGGTVDFATADATTSAAAHTWRVHAGTWGGTLADVEHNADTGGGTGSNPNVGSLSPSWGADVWLSMPLLGSITSGLINGCQNTFYRMKPTAAGTFSNQSSASYVHGTHTPIQAASYDPAGFRYTGSNAADTNVHLGIRKAA
jgi:hypothetical protein